MHPDGSPVSMPRRRTVGIVIAVVVALLVGAAAWWLQPQPAVRSWYTRWLITTTSTSVARSEVRDARRSPDAANRST